jgi:hypothetical protein
VKRIITSLVVRLDLLLAALAALLAGVAYATIPDADGQIDACADRGAGQLRVINAQAGATCKNSETPLSWSTVWPRGCGRPSVATGHWSAGKAPSPQPASPPASTRSRSPGAGALRHLRHRRRRNGHWPGRNSPPYQGEILAVADGNGPINRSDVSTFDSSGACAARDFNLVVSC